MLMLLKDNYVLGYGYKEEKYMFHVPIGHVSIRVPELAFTCNNR